MLDSVSKTGGYGDRSLIAGGLAPASTRVKATTAWYAVVKRSANASGCVIAQEH